MTQQPEKVIRCKHCGVGWAVWGATPGMAGGSMSLLGQKSCAKCEPAGSDDPVFEVLLKASETPLTFNEFQRINALRCNEVFKPLYSWSPTDWGCALAGEVGELCNLLKKRLRGDTVTKEQLAEEIGGSQAYLSLLASRLGIDLAEASVVTFNEVTDKRGGSYRLATTSMPESSRHAQIRKLLTKEETDALLFVLHKLRLTDDNTHQKLVETLQPLLTGDK